ncbi:MAG: PQQ-binding-like beta-propeller repeat protein [Planctomycetia bacterium]|nr:PQQ-binding-like beta-propeller repeat protein [Planctomycetia bacterium]
MLGQQKPVSLIIIAFVGLIAPLVSAAEGQPAKKTAAGSQAPTLSLRTLVQFGTGNLRTRDFIMHLAFSPNGKQIAAVAANDAFPMVVIFDVKSVVPVMELKVPDAELSRTSCVAFSPDGKKLLWGESDGTLALWDLAEDKLLFREKLHSAQVNDAIYSPRGDVVATCSASGEVDLREANDLTEPVRLINVGEPKLRGKAAGQEKAAAASDGRGGGEYVLAFTPQGKQLVVGSKGDGQIFVWNVADGEFDRKVELAHGTGRDSFNPSLNSLAITPDGRQIMSAGQRTVPREQTKLKHVPKNVNLSQVHFWDFKSGKRASVLNGDEDYGFGYAALSPNGKTVAIGDFSRLNFREVGSGKLIRSIPLPGWWGRQPVFSPDGELVAIADNNTIGLFETATGRRLHHDDTTPIGGVRAAAWSPAGDRIVTGYYDGCIRVWDAQSGALVWRRELAPVISLSGWHAGPAFVGFSPDGNSIVVAGRRDEPVEFQNGIIVIYDALTGNPRREIPLIEIRNGALSGDGKTIVAATNHGGIHETHLHAFDVATGKSLFVTPPKEQRAGLWDAKEMRFRPDSQTLVVVTGGGDIYQFDASTGQQRNKVLADYRTPEQIQAGRPREPQLWCGTLSADGKTLVSSSAEWVYVWDVDTGAMRIQMRHPHDHGCHLCLAPDGKTLATSDLQYAGDYGTDTIRLYDIENGDVLLTLEPVGDRAGIMSFSPDGKRLFTGFNRGLAIVWNVER